MSKGVIYLVGMLLVTLQCDAVEPSPSGPPSLPSLKPLFDFPVRDTCVCRPTTPIT